MANAPMETKVKVATTATYLGLTGLLAVLHAASDINIVAGLPDVAEVFVAPTIPAAITLVAGWLAKHTPRPAPADGDTTAPGYLG